MWLSYLDTHAEGEGERGYDEEDWDQGQEEGAAPGTLGVRWKQQEGQRISINHSEETFGNIGRTFRSSWSIGGFYELQKRQTTNLLNCRAVWLIWEP